MKKLLVFLLLLPLFSTTCYAEELYDDAAEDLGLYSVEDGLQGDEKEIIGELDLGGSYDTGGALSRLFKSLLEKFSAGLKEELKSVFAVAAISVFCAAGMSVCAEKGMGEYISMAACVAVAAMAAGSMDGIISTAVSSLNRLSDYSKAAMPAVFSAAAACGAVVSSPAKYAAVCLSLDVLMSVSQKLVIPLIYCYIAISITGSVSPNSLLSTAGRVVKWTATTVMTGLTIVFSAYIGLTGLITGSTDATAVKTAKTVISSSLPVVGGIISDAAAVVLSAASVIKNSAGVFCLVAVCALCAGPFAMLSVKVFLFKISAAVADMIPGGRLSGLLNDIGTAMSMLLGLVGCCGIMLFFSFMAAIKVVAA